MSITVSSYVPTGNAAGSRAADALTAPIGAQPQACTVYVKFVERGTAVLGTKNDIVLCCIGSVTGAAPRLQLDYNLGAGYRLIHQTASGNVSVTLVSKPNLGDLVELRGMLSATGSVQLNQSINRGAETTTTTSATLALATAWNTAKLAIGSINGAASGETGIIACAVMRGVQSLDTMRRIAGTHTRNG